MKTLVISTLFFFQLFYLHEKLVDHEATSNMDLAEILDARYSDGYIGFAKDLYAELKYPERSRAYAKTGLVKVGITVQEDGVVRSVEILDGLGSYVDAEVLRVLNNMSANWKASHTSQYLEFNIAFKFNQNFDEINGDFNIIASTDIDISSIAALEERLKKSMSEGNQTDVINYLESTLLREPNNEKYRQLYEIQLAKRQW